MVPAFPILGDNKGSCHRKMHCLAFQLKDHCIISKLRTKVGIEQCFVRTGLIVLEQLFRFDSLKMPGTLSFAPAAGRHWVVCCSRGEKKGCS